LPIKTPSGSAADAVVVVGATGVVVGVVVSAAAVVDAKGATAV
jgi:hypothetical protein